MELIGYAVLGGALQFGALAIIWWACNTWGNWLDK